LIDSSVANFGKIAQWKWNFNDGTTDTRTITGSSTKTFVKAGNYNVTLQVITDSGCQSQPAARTIAIHPLPIVDFTVPAVCLPDGRATFNDLSTIADGSESLFSYSWNFGDPNNRTGASEKSPTHRYSSTGPFTIQLSVTTNNGCTDSAAKQLTTVYPQPKASFSVSPTDSCLGATFSFLDASSGVTGNITKWSWNFGDGSNSTLQNPSRRFATARTFNVSLFIINEQGCASDTTIKAVTVHPYPVVNAGQDLFVLEGANARINATSTGTNQRYRWTPATYLDKDSVLKPTTTPPNDITYRLTVTSAGGCTGYDEVYVKVLKSPGIPTAFSPNGDGINDVWNIKYLESYPASTVEIYNRYGQQVYTSRGYGKAWDGTTKGSPLPAGVYYYIINPGNGAKKYSGSVTILR
jgi:gliding motility-associated-like protein